MNSLTAAIRVDPKSTPSRCPIKVAVPPYVTIRVLGRWNPVGAYYKSTIGYRDKDAAEFFQNSLLCITNQWAIFDIFDNRPSPYR
jgi:hypothetical protein